MPDIDKILEQLLSDPRLREGRAFASSRTYGDEPIIRRGSQMHGFVPEPIKQLREMQVTPQGRTWSEARLFFEQAKLLEDHRPMTHDLLKSTLEALGAELLSVRITKVSGTTFYAQLVLRADDGSEHLVDARPSDAIALAVRCDVKILADEAVLEAASMLDFKGVREAEQAAEMAEFHKFVENLSPDDFK